ncbi:MAG: acyl-CoA desaturase [Kofleriaceae bacterium]
MVTAAQAKSLRAQLHAAGVFEFDEGAAWRKLAITLTLAAAAMVGVVVGPLWLSILLVPVVAAFIVPAAMLGHEGSHRSISPSPRRNALMQHICFPLLSGLGALHWRNKHDVLHHGHPNVQGADPDITLWPMTSCAEDHQRANPLRRWLQRNVQGYIFWPLTLLLPTMMRISSIKRLGFHARKRGLDGAFWADALCQLAHYTLWVGIPVAIWGLPALAVYLGVWAAVGVMLALIFAPAHIGLPVIHDQITDWEHQLETTRNLALPRWLSWFFVGLDYQIEHHLFPKIPHSQLPRAAAIVGRWCDEIGLRHETISYGPAVVDVTRFLHNAWRTPSQPGVEVRSVSEAIAAAVVAGRPGASDAASGPVMVPPPARPSVAAMVAAASGVLPSGR